MTMAPKEEILFEMLSRVIVLCQEMQNDSRTPIEDATALTPLIRKFVSCKRELHKKACAAAAVNAEHEKAVQMLKELNGTVKAEVLAHKHTMEFIKKTAETAAAVLDLAAKAAKIV